MGAWAEVSKINSDFANEPLNFNNYINDISIFGMESYVFDESNSVLWRQLITRSLTMFGHDAIHDYVYDRFTDSDVDYMIAGNFRLGQSFNSFYNTDVFASGQIDSVLSEITSEAYNTLESKLQRGINRYINAMTAGNTAGQWLSTVFEIESLANYTTISSILQDTALWNNTILNNESLRLVICNSASAIAFSDSLSNTVFGQFVETVAMSTPATMALIEQLSGNNKLTQFFGNETVCETVAASESSMKGICYSLDGFPAMIASETAMNAVTESETAIDVIIGAIETVAKSENALTSIKGSLENIEEQLEDIPDTADDITEVENTIEVIDGTLSKLYDVTGKADILAGNVDRLLDTDSAMIALAYSQHACDAIASSIDVIRKIALSDKGFSAVNGSDVLFNALNSSQFVQTATGVVDTSGSDSYNGIYQRYGNIKINSQFVYISSNTTAFIGSKIISGKTGKMLSQENTNIRLLTGYSPYVVRVFANKDALVGNPSATVRYIPI